MKDNDLQELAYAHRCSCVQATIHFSAADEASDIQGWMESLGLQVCILSLVFCLEVYEGALHRGNQG